MKEKDESNNVNTGKEGKSNKNNSDLLPYIIAVGVLIGYGFFIYFLIGKSNAKELDWSRLIYLFSGVEAIVFAAVGFLFGREVNRKRAENAEKSSELAEKQKEVIKEQVVKERNNALILGAMAVQAEKSTSSITDLRSDVLERTPTPSSIGSIAEKAKKMYPELNN
ncbi:MAG: hypothetical protein R3243_04085 [Arenibacter latericius]|nr:hypothetical protein [Arenibacter latericius]